MTLILTEHGVGGYENTGWDLVSNMVGAVAGGLGSGQGSDFQGSRIQVAESVGLLLEKSDLVVQCAKRVPDVFLRSHVGQHDVQPTQHVVV